MVNLDGSEIKQKRVQLGLTQDQLSQLTGISVQTLSRYENGKIELTGFRTKNLEIVLNTPPEQLPRGKLRKKAPPKEKQSEGKHHWGNVVHGKCKKCIYYCRTVECCDFYITTNRHHDKIDEAHGGCTEFWPAKVKRKT